MTEEPELRQAGDSGVRYYKVDLETSGGRPSGGVRPMTGPGGRGKSFWVLVALAASIVILVVLLLVIEVSDGRAVESSFAGPLQDSLGALLVLGLG
jgi:hypothetical protein